MPPLFKRHARRHRRYLFDDLPREAQWAAEQRLWRYLQKHRGNLKKGIFPILVGQARRWTMTSQEERSQWGRTMFAKRGGYAVQRLFNQLRD